MSRPVVVVVVLVGVLIIPLVLNKCSHKKPMVEAPETPPPAPIRAIPEKKQINYGLTFSMAPVEDNDSKDVARLTCEIVGDQTLERPYRDACNPVVGDTSCRMVLPVLCILPGPGDLAASQAVMGAQLDSEMQGNVMCAREFGMSWRMASFSDGRNFIDTPQYDHVARGDRWRLSGKMGPGLGGYGRFWVKSTESAANCW